MKKIKLFFKRLFCKHEFIESNLNSFLLYKKTFYCRKCGFIIIIDKKI